MIFLVLFAWACDEHDNWRDFGEAGVLRGAVPPRGIRTDLDSDARFERRRLDVQRRLALAPDKPRPRSLHCGAGAGSRHFANLSVRATRGSTRGYFRQA